MNKTETNILESLASRNRFHGFGKRVFLATKKLKEAGKLDGFSVTIDCFNGNGSEFKSQWNSPSSFSVYEISIKRI